MTFDNEELELIRDALKAFTVGVTSIDELRETLIVNINEYLAAD